MSSRVNIPKGEAERLDWKRLIVVLENAPLEPVKVGAVYKLASTDSPNTLKELQKKGKDTTIYRPDILHYVCTTQLSSSCSHIDTADTFG